MATYSDTKHGKIYYNNYIITYFYAIKNNKSFITYGGDGMLKHFKTIESMNNYFLKAFKAKCLS